MRFVWLALGLVVLGLAAPGAGAQVPVRNRIAVLEDTSASMLLTPEHLTFTETCPGWNPCTFFGNPTTAQENCNACVRDTIRLDLSCAMTWDLSCQGDYDACQDNVSGQTTCSPTLTATDGLTTRGDGSLEIPGCDLDADGLAGESRLFQAKQALGNVVAVHTDVEFSLWRFHQVTGGQTCATSGTCPSLFDCENHDGNGGTPMVCAFDADVLDGPTTAGFEGQCDRYTHTGSPATFACTVCNFTVTYDRAQCELYELDEVRSGGVSPLDGSSAVACFPLADPSHRFIKYRGAACNQAAGDLLVSFPPTGADDNRSSILAWIDHQQPQFSTDDELRANGDGPIAAALRDLRTATLAALEADVHVPCRRYRAVLVVDNADSCEPPGSAIAAAAALQDLSFVNGAGVPVSGYDVPVAVIGFAVCPPENPGCAARLDLDAIAAAGGTGSAVAVASQAAIELALEQIVADTIPAEICNGLDDDCDGATDEFACPLFADGFESGNTSAWDQTGP